MDSLIVSGTWMLWIGMPGIIFSVIWALEILGFKTATLLLMRFRKTITTAEIPMPYTGRPRSYSSPIV